MSEIVNFERKPETITNSNDWKPLDALKSLVKAIEDGEADPNQLAVIYWHGDEEQGRDMGYYVAGLSFPEYVALLNVALHRALDEWRG